MSKVAKLDTTVVSEVVVLFERILPSAKLFHSPIIDFEKTA